MREPTVDDTENDDRFRVDVLSASSVTSDMLAELEVLYAGAYHNSRMFERLLVDLSDPPEVFRMFLARDTAGGRVVGARAIQSTSHAFVDYHGFAPIHGKRFCVDPTHRGRGLGRRLVHASNHWVFDELGEPVVFGESNEIGALVMHCRGGAFTHVQSVTAHFARNSPDEALALYAEFLINPRLRRLRLPNGPGVQFVYCREEAVAEEFLATGYATWAQLVATAATPGETSAV